MNENSYLFEEFYLAASDVLIPLQTQDSVRSSELLKVEEYALQVARHLKGEEYLPRKTLVIYRKLITTLQNEAPDRGEESSKLLQLAARIENTFDLILAGESPDDRIPGVPRII
ncbi:hypothetical protein [Pseudomonas sp. RIT-PI-S]|uniref:hypothetical protein n=1 Tax=Pseudomonas sp. RIT-PI-S TaxID=3035295 RepID=UPI0021DB6BA8|nr:hypothetical protein [Pseudomonas sp. RIT-PI-S]